MAEDLLRLWNVTVTGAASCLCSCIAVVNFPNKNYFEAHINNSPGRSQNNVYDFIRKRMCKMVSMGVFKTTIDPKEQSSC